MKYLDFANVFFFDFAAELLEHYKINYHLIVLAENK